MTTLQRFRLTHPPRSDTTTRREVIVAAQTNSTGTEELRLDLFQFITSATPLSEVPVCTRQSSIPTTKKSTLEVLIASPKFVVSWKSRDVPSTDAISPVGICERCVSKRAREKGVSAVLCVGLPYNGEVWQLQQHRTPVFVWVSRRSYADISHHMDANATFLVVAQSSGTGRSFTLLPHPR